MRFAPAIALAAVAVAACAGDVPTAAQRDATKLLASARGSTPAAHDSVEVALWRHGPGGLESAAQQAFGLDQFTDGVTVSFPEAPVALDGHFRAGGRPVYDRPAIAKASFSVDGGVRLYDRAGATLRFPDVARIRVQAGLVATSSREAPQPRMARATPGPRRYVDRIITPQRAAQELQGLGNHADSSETLPHGQRRFVRTQGEMTQSWVFDDSIGGVVEVTVDRAGRRHLLVQNEYQQRPGGYALTRATSTWFGRDGQPTMRSTKRFLTP